MPQQLQPKDEAHVLNESQGAKTLGNRPYIMELATSVQCLATLAPCSGQEGHREAKHDVNS